MQNFIEKHIRADVTEIVLVASDNYGRFGRNASPHALDLVRKGAKLNAPFLDYEAAARAAGWEPNAGPHNKWADGNKNGAHYAQSPRACRYICEDHNIAPHAIPIIGHYIVAPCLADKLEAVTADRPVGERVERDFGGVIVWARKDPQAVGRLDLQCDPVLLAIVEGR